MQGGGQPWGYVEAVEVGVEEDVALGHFFQGLGGWVGGCVGEQEVVSYVGGWMNR